MSWLPTVIILGAILLACIHYDNRNNRIKR